MLKPYYTNRLVTLYHGDCRAVLKELRKEGLDRIDLIFADPPYGHNNNNDDLIARREIALGQTKGGNAAPPRPILNDGEEATPMLEEVFAAVADCCCCCCCCCCGGGPDPQFARWSLLIDKYMRFAQMVIWDKGPMGMGWHYRRSYECVLVAYGKFMRCEPWYDNSHKVENIIRPNSGIPKIIPGENDHPTPKPPSLAEKFIKLHTPADGNALVVDPFAGGGSTGVAAMRTGRRAILIELDERFCELSARQLDAADGELQLF